MNFKKFLFAICVFPSVVIAQTRQFNASEIAQEIAGLSVKSKVLYVAAHPDDENTRLLAYLAKEVKANTAYLSLTRGDGGQNLIGTEQAEGLGLIRTQELLAARKVDGADQFFTRANDFGFSKTAEETFKIWGKQQVLADAVWLIRKFRPDVIITRFPEDKRAGHGHHAASAIIAREAFAAAADPKQFPEQLKNGVSIWQAKRLVWNTFNFGGNNTTSADQLKINVGLYNPILGKNYGEIAAISRTNHKSQGFGSTLQRGEAFEHFSHTAGEKAKTSLFDGVDALVNSPEVLKLVNDIQQKFNIHQPAASISSLLELKKIAVKQGGFKHQLLDELILACAGFYAEAVSNQQYFAIGDEIPYSLNVIFRGGNTVPKLNFAAKEVTLQNNKVVNLPHQLKTTEADLTQPYYLRNEHPLGHYIIDQQIEVGQPENKTNLHAKFTVEIGGELISRSLPIHYKFTDPIKGEQYQPLVISPKVTASLSDQAYLFVNNQPKTIEVNLRSFSANIAGEVIPVLPSGWKSTPEKLTFDFKQKSETQLVFFTITPSKNAANADFSLIVNYDGQTSTKGFKNIRYDHIPDINIFPNASAKLLVADLKIGGKKIAYLEGAGDLVARNLKQVGYDVTSLTSSQILLSDLSGFDAIVTGIRFFNVDDEAKNVQTKLMEYVKNGGVVLQQYNVSNGLKTLNLGPYPFKLTNKRVTEEDARVTLSKPTHSALNYPNKITDNDFDGWVQERGLYFVEEIDSQYETILSINDEGEPAHQGSLISANYGKGKFVYTSLSFFRQLPAGVPGAYRLFANLLAK
jgi:LmbE family N-acetylglucosaminyl deacetylase